MYDAAQDNKHSVPTSQQVGDIIAYRSKGQTYTGEILAIREPTILKGMHIGWHYVVMRDGANTCFPDIVPVEAALDS